jgi:adenine-specific DNA-methyltransferase
MIKKSLLNELIKTQDLTSLERHLVYSYLVNKKLNYSSSPILVKYFEGFDENIKLFIDSSILNINTIKELENCLELIIPIQDRKVNGAFFTPEFIIDFIIKEISPLESDKNLDPSCGSGAFLVGLVDYYKLTYKKPVKRIIKENIFGSDILEYNIRRAKLILTIYSLQNNEILEESDFNLFQQDSLNTKWELKFENIVGNPPYVKFQDLTNETRVSLAKHWTTVEGGTFNLYFAFFELGYKLLKPEGKLGYITPNNYFTSLAGEALRKYFHLQKCVTRIVDFSHKKVFDAQTYTAITFLNKKKNDSITYDRIKNNQNPESFLTTVNGSPNNLNNLNFKKWRLLKTDEQENISIIESIGLPIGKLFDICVGIATLKDEVFFIDGSSEKSGYFIKSTENGDFEIEKDITRSVFKISDFKSQEEVERNRRRIICPYNIKNGTATPIPEVEFKIAYPKCYSYLLSEKDNLNNRDKGKFSYEPFYVWGRTQGLTRNGKKILNPTFSQYPRFLLVEKEDGFFTNGYGLFFKKHAEDIPLFIENYNPLTNEKNIDVVQKILNSIVMHYYVSKTSVSIEGGYPCYQKNFIEKFTIPNLTQVELDTIRAFSKKDEIDEFLISKYQLKLPIPNLVE